jgi:hypothetical protein
LPLQRLPGCLELFPEIVLGDVLAAIPQVADSSMRGSAPARYLRHGELDAFPAREAAPAIAFATTETARGP